MRDEAHPVCAGPGCFNAATLRADLDIGPSTDRQFVCEKHADDYEDQGYVLMPLVDERGAEDANA